MLKKYYVENLSICGMVSVLLHGYFIFLVGCYLNRCVLTEGFILIFFLALGKALHEKHRSSIDVSFSSVIKEAFKITGQKIMMGGT